MKETEYLKEKNELVDIIHCAFNDWDDYSEECYESHISPIEDVEDFVADAVLHAGYRKQEWISVEDALPEVGEDVLLYSKEDDKIDIGHYSNMFCRFFLRKFEDGNVTHWMPLPDAPKGE